MHALARQDIGQDRRHEPPQPGVARVDREDLRLGARLDQRTQVAREEGRDLAREPVGEHGQLHPPPPSLAPYGRASARRRRTRAWTAPALPAASANASTTQSSFPTIQLLLMFAVNTRASSASGSASPRRHADHALRAHTACPRTSGSSASSPAAVTASSQRLCASRRRKRSGSLSRSPSSYLFSIGPQPATGLSAAITRSSG